jgi:7-cyano-7-deazaguanine synthase
MKVLIICSGGLDSTSMASMYKYEDLTLMTFNYGQKGIKETEVVKELAKTLGAKIKVMDISPLKQIFGTENQLCGEGKIENSYQENVVVPLRNSVFLQIAMVYAYTNKFDIIVLGSHTDDIAEVDGERLYPDCSPEFFKAFELAMDFGTFRKDKKVRIITASILGLGKTDLVRQGYKNLGNTIFKSWSCYASGEKQCGKCESCQNRKKAFKKAGVEDKTDYKE